MISSTDFYDLLGIDRNSSVEQIKLAYDDLCSKNEGSVSPDVSTAYETLIDPDKKRVYDEALSTVAIDEDAEANGTSQEGGVVDDASVSQGRISLSGVISSVTERFIPAKKELDISDFVKSICGSGTLEDSGVPMDARIQDLAWGSKHENMILDRQNRVHFYKLTVDVSTASKGFSLYFSASSRWNMHLGLYDAKGVMIRRRDYSRQNENSSVNASLLFTPYKLYEFDESLMDNDLKQICLIEEDGNLVSSLCKLDGFCEASESIAPGHYLLAVYHDLDGLTGLLGRSTYSLVAAAAIAGASELPDMAEIDSTLVDVKSSLEQLKIEYEQAIAAYNITMRKIRAENDRLNELMKSREIFYKSYLDKCVRAYLPDDETVDETTDSHPSSVPSESNEDSTMAKIGASLGSVAQSATKTIRSARASFVGSLPFSATSSMSSSSSSSIQTSSEMSNEEQSNAVQNLNEVEAVSSSSTDAAVPSTSKLASAVAQAATNVTAAGGWLANRVFGGFQGTQSTSSTPISTDTDVAPEDVPEALIAEETASSESSNPQPSSAESHESHESSDSPSDGVNEDIPLDN